MRPKFKILILGDSGVGKTSLMNNYVGRRFNPHDPPTIGVEFESKALKVPDVFPKDLCQRLKKAMDDFQHIENPIVWDQTDYDYLCLQIWNSSGQERFQAIVTSYFRNVQGLIIVVDLTKPQTLVAVKKWIKNFNQHTNGPGVPGIPAIMVANKADLDFERLVTNEKLQEFAKEYDLPYFVVSSKTDRQKVDDIFTEIARQMCEEYLKNPQITARRELVQISKQRERKTKGCCSIS